VPWAFRFWVRTCPPASRYARVPPVIARTELGESLTSPATSIVPPRRCPVTWQWDCDLFRITQYPRIEPTRSVRAWFHKLELKKNSSPTENPRLPRSRYRCEVDFSITTIRVVWSSPPPDPDAAANAPPPTTNATIPATPAVVRSLRNMVPPLVVDRDSDTTATVGDVRNLAWCSGGAVPEAAVTLRVSEATVWRRITTGELRAVRLGVNAGSAVRVPAAALNDFIRQYERTSTT
jgi:excisionase family DNA binding protein